MRGAWHTALQAQFCTGLGRTFSPVQPTSPGVPSIRPRMATRATNRKGDFCTSAPTDKLGSIQRFLMSEPHLRAPAASTTNLKLQL